MFILKQRMYCSSTFDWIGITEEIMNKTRIPSSIKLTILGFTFEIPVKSNEPSLIESMGIVFKDRALLLQWLFYRAKDLIQLTDCP